MSDRVRGEEGWSSRSERIEMEGIPFSKSSVIREEWNFAINVNRQRYTHTSPIFHEFWDFDSYAAE